MAASRPTAHPRSTNGTVSRPASFSECRAPARRIRSRRIFARVGAIMSKAPPKPQKSKANAMWGGRFSASPDALMEAINESISVDHRLAAEDIQGSLVHSDMLAAPGIITAEDPDAIQKGLY